MWGMSWRICSRRRGLRRSDPRVAGELCLEINAVTLQFLILALPGFIWVMLESANQHPSKSPQFTYFVRVFVFGLFTYSLLALIYRIVGKPFQAFDFYSQISSDFASKIDEILWSIPTAVILSLIWIAGRTHSWIPSLLRYFKISDYSGCEDIWEYSLSNKSGVGKWVNIRDFDNKLVIQGYVGAFSDRNDLREVLLLSAAVFKDDGDKLYEQQAIYVGRKADSIHMEFCQESENG